MPTPRTARSVMVAWEWARNAPRQASSATATAIPAAAASSRPGRRRSSPAIQMRIMTGPGLGCRHLRGLGLRLPMPTGGLDEPAVVHGPPSVSRAAISGSWVETTRPAPSLVGGLQQHVHDLAGGVVVELAGGFVGQDQRRARRRAPGRRPPVGPGRRTVPGEVCRPGRSMRRRRSASRPAPVPCSFAGVGQQEREGHVFQSVQRGEQAGALEDDADPARVLAGGARPGRARTGHRRWRSPGRPSGAAGWTCRIRRAR